MAEAGDIGEARVSVVTRSGGRRVTTSPPVLVTDDTGGQSRSALAAVRALGTAGYHVTVSIAGERSMAGSSRHCSRQVRVPPPSSDEYAEALAAEVAATGHVAVFPSSDRALVALALPGAELVDKARLAQRLGEAGIPAIHGHVVESGAALLGSAIDLEYPVVVKPALKTAGAERPAARVDGPEGLSAWRDVSAPLVVQPFIDAPMRAAAGVVWGGRLLAIVHQRYVRTWPSPCGTASYAETTAPDPDLETRLEVLLRGHDGVFQAQLMGDYLIDVNPRVYGSLPLAVAAGANLPAVAARAAGGVLPERLVRARPGVRYRWLEGDLRSLASGVRTGTVSVADAVAGLRPRAGTAHSVTALADPLPGVARLRHVLAKARG